MRLPRTVVRRKAGDLVEAQDLAAGGIAGRHHLHPSLCAFGGAVDERRVQRDCMPVGMSGTDPELSALLALCRMHAVRAKPVG